METIEIINLIAAIIVSPVVYLFLAQLIKRPEWKPWVKAALAVVVSGIVAIAQTWVTGELQAVLAGELTAAALLAYWGIVYAAGQIVYNAIGGADYMARLGEWPAKK